MITYVPGTCGEWIQGWLNEEPVLISCPIEWYSNTSIQKRIENGININSKIATKALKAAKLTLNELNSHQAYHIELDSKLPKSKGYGSSTADVVSVCAAIYYSEGVLPSPESLGRIACMVEPSDSTMFPGWNIFAYRTGNWHLYLGEAIRLPLIILDGGDTIDTVSYNHQLNLGVIRSLENATHEAVDAFKMGVEKQDAYLLGTAAKLSANNYQRVCHSSLVEQASIWSDELGACGIIRAHSGSIVGLLFQEDDLIPYAVKWLKSRFYGKIHCIYTTGGGVRYSLCQK